MDGRVGANCPAARFIRPYAAASAVRTDRHGLTAVTAPPGEHVMIISNQDHTPQVTALVAELYTNLTTDPDLAHQRDHSGVPLSGTTDRTPPGRRRDRQCDHQPRPRRHPGPDHP